MKWSGWRGRCCKQSQPCAQDTSRPPYVYLMLPRASIRVWKKVSSRLRNFVIVVLHTQILQIAPSRDLFLSICLPRSFSTQKPNRGCVEVSLERKIYLLTLPSGGEKLWASTSALEKVCRMSWSQTWVLWGRSRCLCYYQYFWGLELTGGNRLVDGAGAVCNPPRIRTSLPNNF